MGNYNITEAPEGARVAFENAADAQSARAILLLSGVPPADVAGEGMDSERQAYITTGLTAQNYQTDQAMPVLIAKGKTQKDFQQLYESGIAILGKVKERATAAGVTLGDPVIRYSGSEQKLKVAFSVTDSSQDQKNSKQLAESLRINADIIEKGGEGACQHFMDISLPMFSTVNKLKLLGERLTASAAAPNKPALTAAMRVPLSAAAKPEIPIKIPGTETKDYAIKTSGEEGICVVFPDTTEGKIKAAAARSLVMMCGKHPDTLALAGVGASAEELEKTISNPEVIIVGMNQKEFDAFYVEWLGQSGLVSRLQTREKNKGLTLGLPSIRIRSNGEPRAVFPLNPGFAANAPTALIEKLANHGVVASDAQAGESQYIDIPTTPEASILAGLKAYVTSPTLSVSSMGIKH